MSTTYYICKYTPVELLEAFGGECAILNHMPDNFELSDQVAHPNICGFGKSLLEACMEGKVKELVLVNCCDTIRSAYDVLLEYGKLDFLFLLDIMHSGGTCSREHAQHELRRLAESYGAYKGTSFDAARFREAFRTRKRPTTPYISVLGARVGDELFQLMEKTMPLPVRNDTCVNNRAVALPEELDADFDTLMADYARTLLGQIPCMRMIDTTGRKVLYNDPHLRGVIYHTVKFCDYYGFEYSELKGRLDVPLLKLESDYTIQSSGQLLTRLEAFAESIAPERTLRKETHTNMNGKGLYAGIDSGSTSTDVVIIDRDKNIIAQSILPTGAGAAAGADRALDEALAQAGLSRSDINATVTTGYGRTAVGLGDQSITEITCHAKGAYFLDPSVRTIIDIGGQDSKVIRLDENGNVTNFVMNDKCAAGTGRFLELMARTLELSLDDMSRLGLEWKEDVTISSMCTVFAESEVVSLIAENRTPADIIHGLNRSVATKTCALCRRVGGEENYMMTGGVSKNRGVVTEIEKILGVKLHISDKAQLNGALGAALFALELE
ncbi:MAG: acyl-CoA dehydratase activase [Peptococcaceae bacterium]|nr:acyl-CoA dehydratase activase [Peptococcaceae bacterium]